MIESFLIVFRESLEAAIIVGVVTAFLKKNNMQIYYPLVLIAISAAVVASLLGAFLFSLIEGGFTGSAEAVFEGLVMLLAAGFLTYMIVWLYNQKNAKNMLEQKLSKHVDSARRTGVFFLIFFAVLREGIETVLFMNAVAFNAGATAPLGGFIGLTAAIIVGYLLFVMEVRLPVKRFFQLSGVLLIFFAAGLLANGFHELQEAGIFWFSNDSSVIQLILYLAYLLTALGVFFRPKKLVLDTAG